MKIMRFIQWMGAIRSALQPCEKVDRVTGESYALVVSSLFDLVIIRYYNVRVVYILMITSKEVVDE